MTPTPELRIRASLDIIKAKNEICYEIISDLDKMIEQCNAMKKEITSLIDFLERRRKFG